MIWQPPRSASLCIHFTSLFFPSFTMSRVNSASVVPNEKFPNTHQRNASAACKGESSSQSTKFADRARKFAFHTYSGEVVACGPAAMGVPAEIANTAAHKTAAARCLEFSRPDPDFPEDTIPSIVLGQVPLHFSFLGRMYLYERKELEVRFYRVLSETLPTNELIQYCGSIRDSCNSSCVGFANANVATSILKSS